MTKSKMTKTNLFLELAKPDKNGISRFVSTDEFVNEYASLAFGNGASWARKESVLAKNYIVSFTKAGAHTSRIIGIKLDGYNNNTSSQIISTSIKKIIHEKRCVILGTSNPEVDHKNGRKNDSRIHITKTQTLEDFQPLSKAANDAKRQFCKECIQTNIRYDAKQLGYPISYYKGNENHDGTELGCEGCFWYDPTEFRKHLIEKK